MKRSVNYLLCGLLTLLGFTSCAALRDARQARLERERLQAEAQQKALIEQILKEMEAKGAADPERQAQLEQERQQRVLDSIRRADRERNVLLYAVPNVPYREIKEK